MNSLLYVTQIANPSNPLGVKTSLLPKDSEEKTLFFILKNFKEKYFITLGKIS